MPGTTRDLLTRRSTSSGLADDDGRHRRIAAATNDEIEVEGMRRARAGRRDAQLALVVLDQLATCMPTTIARCSSATRGRAAAGRRQQERPARRRGPIGRDAAVPACSRCPRRPAKGWTRCGRHVAEALAECRTSRDHAGGHEPAARWTCSATRADAALERARGRPPRAGMPEEFVAGGSARGARPRSRRSRARGTADDLLHAIFARFCIGK